MLHMSSIHTHTHTDLNIIYKPDKLTVQSVNCKTQLALYKQNAVITVIYPCDRYMTLTYSCCDYHFLSVMFCLYAHCIIHVLLHFHSTERLTVCREWREMDLM